MTAYVESSVVLRLVLGQPDQLRRWAEIARPVTSALTEVECLRTLDRRLRQGTIRAAELPTRRGLAIRLIERMERVDVTGAVLRRASEPFPTPLRTLDALHLATAVLWAGAQGLRPVFATHDGELAQAAVALGFDAIGV